MDRNDYVALELAFTDHSKHLSVLDVNKYDHLVKGLLCASNGAMKACNEVMN